MGAMIDDGVEHGGSSAHRSGQPARSIGMDEADRAASRRRLIITSLLAPPLVMTLRAHSARAGGKDSPSCAASINPSNHCT
jgi:hypothetical protein